MATIAWIGLGNMGGPMTANLVKAGHTVRGFDLDEKAMAAAEGNGVQRATSVADTVQGAEAVFTMLPKGDNCRAVYLGDDGILAHAEKGAMLVDSSTIDIKTSAELHQAAEQAGFRFVDAPVSGGISGAAAGTLCFMVGGSEEDFRAASPFIEPMAAKIVHTGAATTGEAAKIVNNMMLFIELQACAEGAVLAGKLGLDAQVFWDIVSASTGNCWALHNWYPVPDIIGPAAANKGFAATFAASLALKDIGLASDAASQVGIELPAAQVAHEQLQKLVDAGFADKDCSLVIRNIDPNAAGVPNT